MIHKPDAATAAVLTAPRHMSEQEFFDWIEHEDVRAEWVDGEVIELMPPGERHQDLSWFLSTLIGLFLRFRGSGRLFYAPFGMHLQPGRSYREPDLLVVLKEHESRLDGKRLIGPADLAIEIVGDESAPRDLRDKFREYGTLGVREYWVIDPRPGRRALQMFERTSEGTYVELAAGVDGRIYSRVLTDFWLDIRWLEADPLPNPMFALAQIWPETFGAFADAK
jgi:Uma2 family endonuclease